ncbi:MAG: hypothetical protein WCJ58_00445 [bacterium]
MIDNTKKVFPLKLPQVVKPISMVHSLLREISESSKMKMVIKASSTTAIVSIMLLVSSVIFWRTPAAPEETNPIQLPETGNDIQTINYLAPDLGVIFQVPQTAGFQIEYQDQVVTFNALHNTNVYASLQKINSSDLGSILPTYRDNFQTIWSNVEYLQSTKSTDSLPIYEFSYINKISFVPGYEQPMKKVLMFKKIDQTFFQLEITFNNGYSHFEQDIDTFISISNSLAKLPESGLTGTLKMINFTDLSISYDPNVWQLKQSSQNNYLLNKANTYLSNKKQTFNISSQPISDEFSETTLNQKLTEATDLQVANNKFYKIKIPSAEATIAERKFIFTELYDSINFTYLRIYLGINSDKSAIIEINSIFQKDGSAPLLQLLSEIKQNIQPQDLATTSQNTFQIVPQLVIPNASVVELYSRHCFDLAIENNPDIYKLCSVSWGNGFFINNNGYLLTNAQLSAPNELDLIIDSIYSGFDQNNLQDYLTELSIKQLRNQFGNSAKFENLSSIEFNRLTRDLAITYIINGFTKGQITISNLQSNTFVQNNAIFQIDQTDLSLQNPEAQLPFQLVAANKIGSSYELQLGSEADDKRYYQSADLALLKPLSDNIDNYAFIPIPIEQANITENASLITAINYDSSEEITIQTSANLISGTIKTIEKNPAATYDLILWNSENPNIVNGSPLIDDSGNLLGIATTIQNTQLGNDSNAAITNADIVAMLEKNGISTSSTIMNSLLKDAVTAYKKGYFSKSIKILDQAGKNNPLLERKMATLRLQAIEEVNAGRDHTPILSLNFFNLYQTNLFIIIFASIALIICIISIISVIPAARRHLNLRNLKLKHLHRPHPIIVQTQMIGTPL